MAPSIFARKKVSSPSAECAPDLDAFGTATSSTQRNKLSRMRTKNQNGTPVGLGLARSDSVNSNNNATSYSAQMRHLRNMSSVEDNRSLYSMHRRGTDGDVGSPTSTAPSLTANSLRMIENMPRITSRQGTFAESIAESEYTVRGDPDRDGVRNLAKHLGNTRNRRLSDHSQFSQSVANSWSPTPTISQPTPLDMAQARIRELEEQNSQLESDLEHKTSVLNTLRQNPLLAQKEAENTSAINRQKGELQSLLESRTNQLSSLQASQSDLLDRISCLESTLTAKTKEAEKLQEKLGEMQTREQIANTIEGLGLADMGRRLVDEIRLRQEAQAARDAAATQTQQRLDQLRKEHAEQLKAIQQKHAEDMARAMANEEQKRINQHKKSKEEARDAAAVAGKEAETRVAEVMKQLGSKITSVEQQRTSEREEHEQITAHLRRDIANLEQQVAELSNMLDQKDNNLHTLSVGNNDLILLVKKLTGRLAEEKKKTRALTAQLSDGAVHATTISSAVYPEELTQQLSALEAQLAEKDEKLTRLETTLANVRRERNDFETAWARTTADLAQVQHELTTVRELSLSNTNKPTTTPPPDIPAQNPGRKRSSGGKQGKRSSSGSSYGRRVAGFPRMLEEEIPPLMGPPPEESLPPIPGEGGTGRGRARGGTPQVGFRKGEDSDW